MIFLRLALLCVFCACCFRQYSPKVSIFWLPDNISSPKSEKERLEKERVFLVRGSVCKCSSYDVERFIILSYICQG